MDRAERNKAMKKEYEDGSTLREIAFRYDLSQSSVHRILVAMEVTMRRTGYDPGTKHHRRGLLGWVYSK